MGRTYAVDEAAGRTVHHCLVYDDGATALAAFVRFVEDGVRAGGQVVVATRWAPEHLRYAVSPAARAAEADGRLQILTAADCYAGRSGAGQIAWLRDTAAEAAARGHTSLWVGADATEQANATDPDDFLDYEMLVDRLLLDVDVVGLCAYDRRLVSEPMITHLGACHPSCEGAPVPATVVADPDGARVDGELDTANAEVAARLLARPDLDAGAVIDVAGLRFVDLAGARALLRALEAHRRAGRPLTLRHPRRQLRALVDLLDASGAVTITGAE